MLRLILILGTISLTQTFYIQTNIDHKVIDNEKPINYNDDGDTLSKSHWQNRIYDKNHGNHLVNNFDNFRKLYYKIAKDLPSAMKNEKIATLEIALSNKFLKSLKRVPRRIHLNHVENEHENDNDNDNEVLPRKNPFHNKSNNNNINNNNNSNNSSNNENNLSKLNSDYLMVDNFHDYYDNDPNDDIINHARSMSRSTKCCDFKNFLMKAIFKRKTEELSDE